jgi:hypothetical protein
MKLLLIGIALLAVLSDVRTLLPKDVFAILFCLSALVLIQGGKKLLNQGVAW